jgi:hypothetical protein
MRVTSWGGAPNKRMKLPGRGGRGGGVRTLYLIAAAAARSLCADR